MPAEQQELPERRSEPALLDDARLDMFYLSALLSEQFVVELLTKATSAIIDASRLRDAARYTVG